MQPLPAQPPPEAHALQTTQCPFLTQFSFLALPSSSLLPTPPRAWQAPSLPPRCKPKLCPPSAPQPEQTVLPSGLTRPWAVAAHVTKTNTRGGSGGGHKQASTGDPNSRFEPLSPEVAVKKMPKLKC